LGKVGQVSTIIERTGDFPDFQELRNELAKATDFLEGKASESARKLRGESIGVDSVGSPTLGTEAASASL